MPKPRLLNMDLLRIAACIGIIAIHADVITASPTNYLGGRSWWLVAWIHSLSRVSVPLFVMISGYFLLENKSMQKFSQTTSIAFKKLGVPLLIWFPIYYLWNITWRYQSFSINGLITQIITGDMYHLYFIVALIGLYYLTPLFYTIRNKSWLILSALIIAVGHELINYLFHLKLFHFLVIYWLPYLFFYLAGNYIRTHFFLNKVNLRLFIIIILNSLNTYLIYQNTLHYNQGDFALWANDGGNYFTSHFNPLIILNSLLIFSWFSLKKFPLKNPYFTKLIILLSAST